MKRKGKLIIQREKRTNMHFIEKSLWLNIKLLSLTSPILHSVKNLFCPSSRNNCILNGTIYELIGRFKYICPA